MKPWHVGVLVFAATVAIGISVTAMLEPQPHTAPPASVAVTATPAPTPVKQTTASAKPRAHRAPRHAPAIDAEAVPVAAGPEPGVTAPGIGESGGLFSGMDRVDPGIYHFAE